MNYIILAVAVIAFVVFFVLLIYGEFQIRKNREVMLQRINVETYSVACAGTYPEDRSIPAKYEAVALAYNDFSDKRGQIIDTDFYDAYVIAGKSMQFCGINDGDLAFVRKDFDSATLASLLPCALILRREADINECQYKVRRAWAICDFDEQLSQIVKDIINSPAFKVIKTIDVYDGNKALLDDFTEKRLKRYREQYIDCLNPQAKDKKVVISTTYHVEDGKIRFSIHPVSSVVGKVEYSFPVGAKYQCIS